MAKLPNQFEKLTDKILATIYKAIKKHSPPNLELTKVTDLDITLVKKLKSEYGIGGLIIDVDDTLRKENYKIPKCNQNWLEYMKKEFKICIVSKGHAKENVEDVLKSIGIEYISGYSASKQKRFLEAANKMGLDPENVLVIGDDVINDIYDGNKSGMITAIVKEVVDEEDLER